MNLKLVAIDEKEEKPMSEFDKVVFLAEHSSYIKKEDHTGRIILNTEYGVFRITKFAETHWEKLKEIVKNNKFKGRVL